MDLSRVVVLGADVLMPATYTALVDDSGMPFQVRLDIEVDEESGPQCRMVSVEAREGTLSAEQVRRLPLARFVRLSAQAVAFRRADTGGGLARPQGEAQRRAAGDGVVDAGKRGAARRRRIPVTDELLGNVASVYQGHQEGRRRRTPGARIAPTLGVAAEFNVSRATAARWIAEARKRGLMEMGDGA